MGFRYRKGKVCSDSEVLGLTTQISIPALQDAINDFRNIHLDVSYGVSLEDVSGPRFYVLCVQFATNRGSGKTLGAQGFLSHRWLSNRKMPLL